MLGTGLVGVMGDTLAAAGLAAFSVVQSGALPFGGAFFARCPARGGGCGRWPWFWAAYRTAWPVHGRPVPFVSCLGLSSFAFCRGRPFVSEAWLRVGLEVNGGRKVGGVSF